VTAHVGVPADAGRAGGPTDLSQSSLSQPKAAAANASAFINRIAERFQEKHTPPLTRDRALAMAVGTLEWVEEDGPFGDPRFDWSADGAVAVADEEISYWEGAGNG
jgi:hypothetical protein